MKKTQKIFTIDNLKEKVKQAKALILTDYSGLDVDKINELRFGIKKAGGEFEVIKNSLLHLASKEAQITIEKDQLQGPTAALWIYEDDLAPLQELNKFMKANELPKIKFGFWDKELISIERIKELANLPGLEELKVKLVGILKAPIFGLTLNLKGNLNSLVYLLKARKEKMEGGDN
jgi:large subunit ribosomal protein L10